LIRLGVRAIPFGIAAMFLGFVLKSAGTQAGPAEIGAPGPGLSVFGTIHPDIFRLRAPIGSAPQAKRLRLASLDPQAGFDMPGNAWSMLADTSVSSCGNALLEERFAALDDRPTSFDKSAGSANDCEASFADRFGSAMIGSAMGVRTNAVRSAPDLDVQTRRADAPPKPTIARASFRPTQVRKEFGASEDDGRTAIYDITAQAVYLPGGRRLEAHSGLGELMDNPGYVHVKMRGSTPPNIYNLTLRERTFHGVRAIRLNPVDGGRMHGRAGILAHSYMLGSNGQSNGCVSFSNYPEFLNAYLKGEITRLAVVERLERPPGKLAAGQLPGQVRDLMKAADRNRQYATAQ
jgi:hypothetical protein